MGEDYSGGKGLLLIFGGGALAVVAVVIALVWALFHFVL